MLLLNKPVRRPAQATPICAALVQSDTCSALGITARSTSPVLAWSRNVIAAGHPDCPLEVWRGDVLSLRVRSIHEAANLEVDSAGTGFIAAHKPRARPLVARRAKNDLRPTDGDSHGVASSPLAVELDLIAGVKP